MHRRWDAATLRAMRSKRRVLLVRFLVKLLLCPYYREEVVDAQPGAWAAAGQLVPVGGEGASKGMHFWGGVGLGGRNQLRLHAGGLVARGPCSGSEPQPALPSTYPWEVQRMPAAGTSAVLGDVPQSAVLGDVPQRMASNGRERWLLPARRVQGVFSQRMASTGCVWLPPARPLQAVCPTWMASGWRLRRWMRCSPASSAGSWCRWVPAAGGRWMGG